MARHHKRSSSSLTLRSESASSNDGSSSSDESSASSVDKRSSLASRKGSAKPRKLEKKPMSAYILSKANKTTNDRKGQGPIRSGREECMHVARWIPRGIDMFVILKDTFRIARYLEAEEAAKTSTDSEDEDVKRERKEALGVVTKDAQERHLRTYQRIVFSTPYLRTLIRGRHNRNKLETELNSILSEMQEIIGQIRSEDASHLKPFIGNYAVAQPGVKGLEPPIFSENKKSRARMGVNHPQLAGMLCPVKHVNAYHNNPKKVQEQLQNGEIRMNAAAWPALAYPGDPPGIDFNIEDIQEGFLKGHILKRVLRHIYTSPSSALIDDGELSVTRSGNAKLHGMYKVEAEHIAYALVQSRFGISSRDKWQETDGNYSYRDAYYRTIKAIREPFDEAWAEELLEWWNKAVFGNKRGVPLFDISDDDEDDDDLILMRKQSAKRAAAGTQVEVEPPFNPDISTVVPSTPATSPPPKEEPTLPQQKSVPKPRPVKPAEQLACKTLSSTPALASVPPPNADVLAASDKVKKRKSEELEVDGDGDSSLSEVESVSNSPVVPKRGKKGQKKTATAAATKKRKGRK
ncbi:hypothetical protein BD769DRAFT_1636738 [Suillus cothurnatus]|nr:hypothetical protein BD769DRAFT_1636738 [Suillus cothurnatus]